MHKELAAHTLATASTRLRRRRAITRTTIRLSTAGPLAGDDGATPARAPSEPRGGGDRRGRRSLVAKFRIFDLLDLLAVPLR